MKLNPTELNLTEISSHQRLVRLDRPGSADRYSTGFVVDHSPNLILLHLFHDYLDFGFSILRAGDVEGLRCGEFEEAFETILRFQGEVSAPPSSLPPMADLELCLQYFVDHETFISVECEEMFSDQDESSFLVGIPSEVDGNKLWFLGCDAKGQWESEEEAVEISQITAIQFATPYLSTLLKYILSLSGEET